jgi:hypothetical protein
VGSISIVAFRRMDVDPARLRKLEAIANEWWN